MISSFLLGLLASGAHAPVAPSYFLVDTFKGTANSQLISHTADSGGTWLDDPSYSSGPSSQFTILDPTNGGLWAKNQGATVNSSVVAPSLDCFIEVVLNTGIASTDPAGSSNAYNQIQLWPDQQPGQFHAGSGYVQLQFWSDQTEINIPADTGAGQYFTSSFVDANATITVRTEFRYSTNDIKVFINGNLVAHATGLTSSRIPSSIGVINLDVYNSNVHGTPPPNWSTWNTGTTPATGVMVINSLKAGSF